MNEMFTALGRSLCQPCTEEELSRHAQGELAEGAVTRQVDPTVCAQCQADNGTEELRLVAGMPVCEQCERHYRNRPYPRWLKIAFVTLVILAVASFARNWRFVAGYRAMRQAQRAVARGKLDLAADLMENAARQVPEAAALGAMASIYRGMQLMTDDKPAEAANAFRSARAHFGSLPFIDAMLLQAEGGVAFDAKDYDTFLAKMQAIERLEPNQPRGLTGVASAYACKYAVTGKEEFRKQALLFLERATRLSGPGDPLAKEYEARIRHRLETREIITRKEYMRRFPAPTNSGANP
jgi:hypothetical protein